MRNDRSRCVLPGELPELWRRATDRRAPGTMSASEPVTAERAESAALSHLYDDADDPDEVTLFDDEADDITTAWITADIEDTVSLDRHS